MTTIPPFFLKARGFKCFGEEGQGFEQIKPINIIIGRNNSGKSTLLDFIERLGLLEETKTNHNKKRFQETSEELPILDTPSEYWNGKSEPEFLLTISVTEESLVKNFPKNQPLDHKVLYAVLPDAAVRQHVEQKTFWDVGKVYLNARVTFKFQWSFSYERFSKNQINTKKELLTFYLYNSETTFSGYLEKIDEALNKWSEPPRRLGSNHASRQQLEEERKKIHNAFS